MSRESHWVKIDPARRDFGVEGEPQPHPQHPNQRRGLDLYVRVWNFATGESCFKKLYQNAKGLHFKHTGHSPTYLENLTDRARVWPFHVQFGAWRG